MGQRQYWQVSSELWAGRTVVILASGPSMNSHIVSEVRRFWRHPVIAVNTTFRLAPWADMLYAADDAWWTHYLPEVQKDFYGTLVGCGDREFPNVRRLRVTGKEGYDPAPGCVRTGGNSGYQAIHLAVQAGARRILLCGFDMHGTHWHGRHPVPLRDHGEDIYPRWIARFETLAKALQERGGVEVINCTPGSALKVWPEQSLWRALNDSLEEETA